MTGMFRAQYFCALNLQENPQDWKMLLFCGIVLNFLFILWFLGVGSDATDALSPNVIWVAGTMLINNYCVQCDLTKITFSLDMDVDFELENICTLCELEIGILAAMSLWKWGVPGIPWPRGVQICTEGEVHIARGWGADIYRGWSTDTPGGRINYIYSVQSGNTDTSSKGGGGGGSN